MSKLANRQIEFPPKFLPLTLFYLGFLGAVQDFLSEFERKELKKSKKKKISLRFNVFSYIDILSKPL